MKKSLWFFGALLFASGVVVQIAVRRDGAEPAPSGAESVKDSLDAGGPAPAASAPRAPAETPVPAEPPVPAETPPTEPPPSDGPAEAGNVSIEPPRREPSSQRASAEGGARLEQRLEDLAAAERLPADWARVLEQLTPPGTPGVARRLQELVRAHPELEVAQQVLRTLERLAGAHVVRTLYEIGIERADLLEEAAVRLSRVRGRASAPALIEIVRHATAPDELVAAALRSLGHTGLRQPVDEIRAIAGDPERSANVRVAAAEALGSIADPAGLDALIPLLKAPQRALRRQAIRSLGRIRDPRSIAALRELVATGSNEQERLMAEEALARLEGRPTRRG